MSAPTQAQSPAPESSRAATVGWRRNVRAYVALMKPRIIELLLVTTVPTMVLAAQGWPNLWLLLGTLIGGTLSAGSANAFNSYLDRDIDAVMHRTRKRPLVTGDVSERNALAFAWALAAVSTLWFYFVVGSPLATLLSVLAILGYVVGYTMILKRRTPQNIVWGGIAGCMPVLIGWAAVKESVGWAPVLLFLVIFFWTPPHYWPLSMKFRSDYANADVPMLPVVASDRRVAVEMVLYGIAMVACSLALVFVEEMTWIYVGVVLISGVWFMADCVGLLLRARRGESKLKEMRVFHNSITYLTLVFAAVMVDPFLSESLHIW